MIKNIFPVVAAFTLLGLILLIVILPTPLPESVSDDIDLVADTNTEQDIIPQLPSTILGNFDAAEPATFKSIEGFNWSQSDDSIANGKSNSWIKRIERDDNKLDSGALNVSGEVKLGFPYPWSGASVGSFKPPIQSYDISNKLKITFDIKGTPGEYRVMFFSSDNKGIPPSQRFIITRDWQNVSIALASFQNLNTNDFSGLAIVAGPAPSKFEFTVDNVLFE